MIECCLPLQTPSTSRNFLPNARPTLGKGLVLMFYPSRGCSAFPPFTLLLSLPLLWAKRLPHTAGQPCLLPGHLETCFQRGASFRDDWAILPTTVEVSDYLIISVREPKEMLPFKTCVCDAGPGAPGLPHTR